VSVAVLVIEDDARVRGVLDRGLRLAGHRPILAEDLRAGRQRWEAGGFDVVLLDVMLPDGNGIDLLSERRAAGDPTPAIVLTARDEADLRDRATDAGASDFLTKPFAYGDLVACIARAAGGRLRERR
jgi:DNA-binding response OmpR family regulator